MIEAQKNKWKHEDPLGLRLETGTPALLPHSVGQNKSIRPAQIQDMDSISLVREITGYITKGMIYEGRRIGLFLHTFAFLTYFMSQTNCCLVEATVIQLNFILFLLHIVDPNPN